MRVVYIHNIAMPGREANTVNVAKMCNALSGLGVEVSLIAANGAGAAPLAPALRAHYGLEHDFDVHALPAFATRPTAAAIAGALHAQRLGADLVWTRAPHAALAACAAGAPTLLEVHTDISAFSGLGQQAFRRVVRHRMLVGLIVISDALARHMEAMFPNLQGRILVAHDGADDRDADPAPPKPPGAPLSVGYVGSLYPGKGVELIEALARECGHAFTVVGAGAEQRQTPNPPPNLRYEAAVAHADVPALLARFDVLMAPYQRSVMAADGRTDTARWMSPLKLFEYMAARRAVVASDLPVIREVLQDGQTALLCDPDDLSAWATALARLHADAALRNAIAEQGYQRFRSYHTWRRRAEAILRAVEPWLRDQRHMPRRSRTDPQPSGEAPPPLQ
ncbi:MAG TPA: glycosyltransferase family 4 protein [Vitreimonas sp.]|uniref:glycosyltransferase family 4 protein n=1 Tax=Vitreimonas sp. TaxID=3069702 RepID=UPI002D715257|nr:glycosyltransferase family 4 protein [Vitreimonas sp.]HYD86073.1 glycosyltransferase family 4 protein [Vitreimonas sp.]